MRAAAPDEAEDVARRLAEIGFRLEDHNAHLLRRAHQRATTLFQQAFAGRAVTPTQVAVLATLARRGEASQAALGQETAIDTATLSTMLRRLEGQRLVERSASADDQRVTLVRLTREGARLAAELLPISLRVSDAVLEPLKPTERAQFIALLRRIA